MKRSQHNTMRAAIMAFCGASMLAFTGAAASGHAGGIEPAGSSRTNELLVAFERPTRDGAAPFLRPHNKRRTPIMIMIPVFEEHTDWPELPIGNPPNGIGSGGSDDDEPAPYDPGMVPVLLPPMAMGGLDGLLSPVAGLPSSGKPWQWGMMGGLDTWGVNPFPSGLLLPPMPLPLPTTSIPAPGAALVVLGLGAAATRRRR